MIKQKSRTAKRAKSRPKKKPASSSRQMRQFVDRAEAIIGHRFKDPSILATALTHSSAVEDRYRCNERMEFLGDAILGMVVCHRVYEQFPREFEGGMTKIKSDVVSRRVCHKMVIEMGLEKCLILGRDMDKHDVPLSVSAGLYEAVVAAVYLDGGTRKARQFVVNSVSSHIQAAAAAGDDHKTRLQKYAQRKLRATPRYRQLDERGSGGTRCHKVGVRIGTKMYGVARASTKREAEQLAAEQTLRQLGVIKGKKKLGPESKKRKTKRGPRRERPRTAGKTSRKPERDGSWVEFVEGLA